MTRFLASVTSVAEAETALAGGADIVDCKDPGKGALGALPPQTVGAIVRAVGGRRPVSAVTGDLPMLPDVVVNAAQEMAATGVDYIKAGLFAGEGRPACISALAPLAARHRIIGVLFADGDPDFALLPLLAASGFAGVMIDTAGKGAGRLLTHLGMPALDAFVKSCKMHGLMSGLAGSLEPPDVPRLVALAPDFLGFRGALCKGGARGGGLDPQAVAVIAQLVAPHGAIAPQAGVAADETDCIFVSDFIVPMRIGAYAYEHLAPQAVRFSVAVDVLRQGGQSDDMRAVFSYDLIMDAIRVLAAGEAFAMVETVAGRLAETMLAHPRAARVRVKVEKLDLGPFVVGVSIERQR